MNKTAFAQPPYSNDIDEIAIGEPITIFVGDGAAPIATVNNYDDFPCADEEDLHKIDAEAVATARLFCAAPDLLEALQKMDALVETLWKSVPWGKTFNLDVQALNEAPIAAKRAIAKATNPQAEGEEGR